jgi:hypothetical protein
VPAALGGKRPRAEAAEQRGECHGSGLRKEGGLADIERAMAPRLNAGERAARTEAACPGHGR